MNELCSLAMADLIEHELEVSLIVQALPAILECLLSTSGQGLGLQHKDQLNQQPYSSARKPIFNFISFDQSWHA